MARMIISKSESQTISEANALAKKILKKGNNIKHALVIALEGDLGAGKTFFTKALAKSFGIKKRVISPTFVLMKRYGISKKPFKNFYHIDCYRIKKPAELKALGWKEISGNPENIIVIEWAEKIKKILPKKIIKIKFEHINPKQRKLVIHNKI